MDNNLVLPVCSKAKFNIINLFISAVCEDSFSVYCVGGAANSANFCTLAGNSDACKKTCGGC